MKDKKDVGVGTVLDWIEEIKNVAGVGDEEIAEAFEVPKSTVKEWLAGGEVSIEDERTAVYYFNILEVFLAAGLEGEELKKAMLSVMQRS